MMKQRVFRMSIAMVALVLLLGWGFHAWANTPDDLKGKTPPDFTLKTVDGKDVTLSSLKGKVVVIDFWATWCPPCRASLPHIQSLSADKDKEKAGLVVLAVNAQEDAAKIEAFMKKNNYTFTVPMDAQGETLKKYNVEGIPTTLVIGRDGTAKLVVVGFNGEESAKAVDDAVTAALKEEAK